MAVKVHDVIGEARNRTSSHRQIGRHPWHGRSGIGQHHDLVDGGVDGVEELDAQVLSMVLVPSAGDAIFRVGFFLETNVWIQRRL